MASRAPFEKVRLPKTARLAKSTSTHLDLIRGVAALAVMLYHLRGLFFVDFPLLSHKSIPLIALYAITGYGHQAVVVFFVLSGYFIGANVMDAVSELRWSWSTYLVSRLMRLQLVLFPALVLGAIWDHIGMRIPQAFSLYFGGLYKFYSPSVALRSTGPVFLKNLLFLQGIASPVFGSNGPLWSLSYEFWYYMLFPVLALATPARTEIRVRFLYVGLALFFFWLIGPQISLYFLIWLLGALVGRLRRDLRLKSLAVRAPWLAGLIFVGSLAWCRTHPLSLDFLMDSCVALCFALWMYTLLLSSSDEISRSYAYGAKKLAGFSYTLYLTHFPALLLLRGLLDPQGDWQPDLRHVACAMGTGLLVLAYAYGVAEFTEAHTATVRSRLLRPRITMESETHP